MHCAAMAGRLDMVVVFLQAGADHRIKDDDGRTPLDIAKENGYTAIERVFYKRIDKERMRVTSSSKLSSVTGSALWSAGEGR